MKTRKNSHGYINYLIIASISFIALYIRYLGRDVISGDFEDCLNSWYLEVTTPGPGIDSLLAYTGDYPMPYAFMIWLLGKLPIPFLYSLKMVNTLFDFIMAVLIGKITAYFKPENKNSFCLGYCITLLLPNVIINSAFWGQCDGLYTMFLFAAFYCWLQKKYPAMMIMFGLAFSYKLQSVFLLPFVLIVYWLGIFYPSVPDHSGHHAGHEHTGSHCRILSRHHLYQIHGAGRRISLAVLFLSESMVFLSGQTLLSVQYGGHHAGCDRTADFCTSAGKKECDAQPCQCFTYPAVDCLYLRILPALHA